MTGAVAQLWGSSSLQLELKNGPADTSDAQYLFFDGLCVGHLSNSLWVHCEFTVNSGELPFLIETDLTILMYLLHVSTCCPPCLSKARQLRWTPARSASTPTLRSEVKIWIGPCDLTKPTQRQVGTDSGSQKKPTAEWPVRTWGFAQCLRFQGLPNHFFSWHQIATGLYPLISFDTRHQTECCRSMPVPGWVAATDWKPLGRGLTEDLQILGSLGWSLLLRRWSVILGDGSQKAGDGWWHRLSSVLKSVILWDSDDSVRLWKQKTSSPLMSTSRWSRWSWQLAMIDAMPCGEHVPSCPRALLLLYRAQAPWEQVAHEGRVPTDVGLHQRKDQW